jgi:hypothetical protein
VDDLRGQVFIAQARGILAQLLDDSGHLIVVLNQMGTLIRTSKAAKGKAAILPEQGHLSRRGEHCVYLSRNRCDLLARNRQDSAPPSNSAM